MKVYSCPEVLFVKAACRECSWDGTILLQKNKCKDGKAPSTIKCPRCNKLSARLKPTKQKTNQKED